MPIVTLSDDFYQFDRKSHTLSGRRAATLSAGRPMRVVVSRVDLERREMDFRPVARKDRPPLPATASSPSTNARRRAPPRSPADEGRANAAGKDIKAGVRGCPFEFPSPLAGEGRVRGEECDGWHVPEWSEGRG